MKHRIWIKAGVVVSLAVWGCALEENVQKEAEQALRVGGKPFAEQRILSELMALCLEEEGVCVERTPENLNEIRGQLLASEIDAYWEYTGTASVRHRGKQDMDFVELREEELRDGVHWLKPAKFNNTFALVMKRPSGGPKLRTIEDLAARINAGESVSICAENRFFTLKDGLVGLEEAYDFDLPEHYRITTPLSAGYQPLWDDECDVLVGFATDSSLWKEELYQIRDNRRFFPEYRPAPVFRAERLAQLPEETRRKIEGRLACIVSHLDSEEVMRRLNAEVELEGRTPREVAEEFLENAQCGA